jgi:hypothetical protein
MSVFVAVSDFRENLVSVTSLDKDSQYSTLEPKWEGLQAEVLSQGTGVSVPVPAPAPEPAPAPAPRPRPQSFAQKLRSTGKSVKGKLGTLTPVILIV